MTTHEEYFPKEKIYLSNLLAIIHGDGRYNGLDEAFSVAVEKLHERMSRLEEAERLLRKLSDLYNSPPTTASKQVSRETMAEIDEWLLAS